MKRADPRRLGWSGSNGEGCRVSERDRGTYDDHGMEKIQRQEAVRQHEDGGKRD